MNVSKGVWSRILRPLKILFWVIVGIVVIALILYGCMIVGNWMAVKP